LTRLHLLCLPKEKGHFSSESGLSEIWLPFVDEYRTVFSIPSHDMKVMLGRVTEVNLPS
jgi:hypothetical protein